MRGSKLAGWLRDREIGVQHTDRAHGTHCVLGFFDRKNMEEYVSSGMLSVTDAVFFFISCASGWFLGIVQNADVDSRAICQHFPRNRNLQ